VSPVRVGENRESVSVKIQVHICESQVVGTDLPVSPERMCRVDPGLQKSRKGREFQ